MQEIVKWLRNIEHLACEAYLKGAEAYKNDEKLHAFFEENAEDEAWHYHVMGSAAEFLTSIPEIPAAISVDEQTSEGIFRYLRKIEECVEHKTLERDDLIEAIVRLELSEWNDIFLYVINLLTEKTSAFKYPATRFQTHLKKIEGFAASIIENPQLLEKIKKVPSIWVENILIVDDEIAITKLIKSLLNDTGNIDVAYDGEEALKKMDEKFYKLVISDIDMPHMDGISLYEQATQRFPSSKKRFLFVTGSLPEQRREFLQKNNVSYLVKPMEITTLREEAQKILLSVHSK